MVVKRRVIWMADDDWAWIRDQAAAEGMTVSALVRAATALRPPITEESKALFGPDDPQAGTMAFREFNSRPFQPVPKRSAK